jgi:hypothetical protein
MTYPWNDPIGVTSIPVDVVDKGPAVRGKALQRLAVMQRELQHLQTAITDLRGALSHEPRQQRALVSAMMNSRNWVLSLVASHAYLQALYGSYQNVDRLDEWASRAAMTGRGDGTMDPDVRAWDNAHH